MTKQRSSRDQSNSNPYQSIDEDNENIREPIESRHVHLIAFQHIELYQKFKAQFLLPHAMPAFESLAYFHKICPVETLVATQSIQN